MFYLEHVVPAQAGTHTEPLGPLSMGPRLRGDDGILFVLRPVDPQLGNLARNGIAPDAQPDRGVVLAPDGAAPPPPADAPPVADGRRPPADEPDAADDDRLNQDWLDRAIRRDPPPAPRDPNASRRFPPPIDRRRQFAGGR